MELYYALIRYNKRISCCIVLLSLAYISVVTTNLRYRSCTVWQRGHLAYLKTVPRLHLRLQLLLLVLHVVFAIWCESAIRDPTVYGGADVLPLGQQRNHFTCKINSPRGYHVSHIHSLQRKIHSLRGLEEHVLSASTSENHLNCACFWVSLQVYDVSHRGVLDFTKWYASERHITTMIWVSQIDTCFTIVILVVVVVVPYVSFSSRLSVEVTLLHKLAVTRNIIGYHYFSIRPIASKWYVAFREVNLRVSRDTSVTRSACR